MKKSESEKWNKMFSSPKKKEPGRVCGHVFAGKCQLHSDGVVRNTLTCHCSQYC